MAIIGQVDTLGALNAVSLPLNISDSGTGVLCVEITGVFVGTISFFGFLTAAGQTALFPAGAYSIATGPVGVVATTATAPGLFQIPSTGYFWFAKMTAYTSGAATLSYTINALGGGS